MTSERRLGLVLVALALVLAAGFFSETWQTGDDARYIGAAMALVKGEGYTASYLPHHPPENLTPPAHPLLLAAVMKVCGTGVLPGKILGALLYVLATALCYRWALRFFKGEPWTAFCATAAGMFTLGLLSMSCWYMAEMSYLCGAFAALLVFERAEERNLRAATVLGAGMLVGFAYLARGVGLSLLAAGGLTCLLRRRWTAAAIFGIGFALLAVPWMARNWLVVGSLDTYVPHYAGMTGGAEHGMKYPWMRVFHDIAVAFPKYFAQDLPISLFFGLLDGRFLLGRVGLAFLAGPVRALVLLLIVLGFVLRLRKPGVTEAYWVFYWLIISAPPFPPQGNWYVYPMLPLAAAYLLHALRFLGSLAPAPAGERLARVAVLAVLVYNLATAVVGAAIHFIKELPRWSYGAWEPARYGFYRNEYYDAWARFVEAGQWASSNLPPSALLVSRQPQQMYLMVGREGWRYDLAQVPGTNLWDRMQRYRSEGRPVALVEDAFKAYEGASFSYGVAHWALRDLFAHHAGDLELVYSTGEPVTRVWVMRPPGPAVQNP